ncbi:MAG: apolipoprotein N-acyltransferase [Acidobacteria bacterium]|nr:apolipoprotein N-acyltransferase [Acidobacteriota bacterium]
MLERTPRARAQRVFGLGVVTGAVAFAGTLYWITGVMTTYGGLPPSTAVGVNALLVAYLALFIGLFAVLAARGIHAVGPPAIVTTAAAWVIGELGRRYLFGGFPWALLGYSQVSVLPVAQLASVFGVYGVSFLVVLVNAALAAALVRTERRRLTGLGVAVGVVAAIAAWGQWRVSRGALVESAEPVRVAMIQGNVAQDDKRDPGLRRSILETYLSRSQAAADAGARLIVWPESATPQPVEEDGASRAAILDLAARTGADVILGSEEIDRDRVTRYYNAAFHVGPAGIAPETYRKIRLVPFGEYVPLRRWLFFAGRLVAGVADFTPGTDPVTFSVDGHRLGTAICYEVVYPDLIRSFVTGGSELLTTITNDAWFGETSAPHQHFAQAAMRAVEQGRYLVRSANTGISGVVDPYGRVLARTELFEHATVVADVGWIRTRTVYGRTGDLFAWGCAALVLGVLVAGARRRPVRRGGDERGSDA